MQNETQSQPRVVIVGGGFGGLSVARELKKTQARVTVVDRNNYHLFQPLLYQVATAGLSPGDIAEAIRSILKRQKNTEVIMAEVSRIDLVARRIFFGEQTLPYDYLVLAPGAQYQYFGHLDWERWAPGLKTVEDALEIRKKILYAFECAELEEDPARRQALLTFVIVGGGPTGTELAGAIAELAHRGFAADFRRIDPGKARILLIEAGPRILPSFEEGLSKKAEQALERLGVEVKTRHAVEEVRETGATVNGEFIPSHTVLWAAGVAASPMIQQLNCPVDRQGRAMVEPSLSLPGHPEVFVIGDAARVEQQGQPLPGIAPVAMQQGRYVGKRIREGIQGKKSSGEFRYIDKGELATMGRSFAVAEIGRWKFAGFFAWLLWLFVHIFFLIGMENRVLVFIQWAWMYFTYERGARMITFKKC